MYDSVLLPTDGSDGALRAARHARAIARACGATVHVLSVVGSRDDGPLDATTAPELVADRERGAEEAVDRTVGVIGDAATVVTAVERGVPAEVVLEYAEREGVDLIAMGTHGGSGIERGLLGSVADRVVRGSECPVLTAREGPADGEEGYGAILVATDGSETADAAAAHAIDLAGRFDATLHVVNAVDVASITVPGTGEGHPDVVSAMEESGEGVVSAVAERAAEAGVEAVTAVLRGRPDAAIRRYADEEGIDLIAVGTHGRTGLERFLLGSVAERTIRTADPPVLTVRGGTGDRG